MLQRMPVFGFHHGEFLWGQGIHGRHSQPVGCPVRRMAIFGMGQKNHGGPDPFQHANKILHLSRSLRRRNRKLHPELQPAAGLTQFPCTGGAPLLLASQRRRDHPNFGSTLFLQPQREQPNDAFVVRMRSQNENMFFHPSLIPLIPRAAKPILKQNRTA